MRVAMIAAVALVVPFGIASGVTVDVAVGPGLSFNPSSVTIAPGDTVQWNFTGAPHTTTSDTNTGPEVWDSGFQIFGSFLHTFMTAGDYPYYCALHSQPAFQGGTTMNGVVHVVVPAPALSSIDPVSGPTSGGTNVTLTGSNFDSSCTVDFGGAAGTAVGAPTSTTITTTTTAHSAGAVTVTVSCSGGAASLAGAFTFNPVLAIISVDPPSALGGTTVTIHGTAFQSGATVTFRGVASPNVTFVNDTTIDAVVPNIAPGPAAVIVTNPDDATASFAQFAITLLALPAMSKTTLLLLLLTLAAAALLALH